MGAECNKHGVDLHGDTFTGLVCPVCDLEDERNAIGDELAAARASNDELLARATSAETQLSSLRTALEQAERERDEHKAARQRLADTMVEVLEALAKWGQQPRSTRSDKDLERRLTEAASGLLAESEGT